MVVRGLSSVPVIAAFLAIGACGGAGGQGFPEDDAGTSSGSGSGSTSGSSSGARSGSSSGSSSGSRSGSSSGSVSSSSSGTSSGTSSGSTSGSTSGSGSSSGSTSSSSSGGTAACGCHGAPGCAVWNNVYVSWYGFNDNSCETEGQMGCNDIAYEAPVSGYPNAANIVDTEATEHTGTYDDPITAASSADTDPQNPTASNPVHKFESSGGATLSPGTKIYNPEVQKYFIMEDSCIECGDEYACIISPEDDDDGTVPAGCKPGTNLHIDFWMGPQFASDMDDLNNCEDNSGVGNPWTGGQAQVIVNPPPDLPVVTTPLFTGSGAGGGCWTSSQVPSITCQ